MDAYDARRDGLRGPFALPIRIARCPLSELEVSQFYDILIQLGREGTERGYFSQECYKRFRKAFHLFMLRTDKALNIDTRRPPEDREHGKLYYDKVPMSKRIPLYWKGPHTIAFHEHH